MKKSAVELVPKPQLIKPRPLTGLRGRAAMVQLFFMFVVGVYLFAVWTPHAVQEELREAMVEVERSVEILAQAAAVPLVNGEADYARHKLEQSQAANDDWVLVDFVPADDLKEVLQGVGADDPLAVRTALLAPNRQAVTVEVHHSVYGEYLGELTVVVDNTARISGIEMAELSLAKVLVGIYTMMLLISMLMMDRLVYRPVAHLADVTERMAEGDLESSIRPSQGEDEVAQLTHRVDYLRQSIAAQQTDLRAALSSAEEASRAKSDFLATMSHEIRTPMNGVLGMLELLQETHLDDVQLQCTESIKDCGEALLVLINDILDFSKMEAGQFTLDDRPFDLVETVDQAVALVAPRARDNDLALAVQIEPDVPTALHGDGPRLKQVVINLLGNAVKFTEEGTIRAHVSVAGPNGAQRLQVAIEDTGVGIPEDKQASLFDAFTQVDSASNRRYQGTGLGLAICRHLVALMGGDIKLQSTPGIGSCFTIDIPLQLAKSALPQQRDGLEDVQGRVGRMKVLVVDDDPLGLNMACGVVAPWVASVARASTAAEALEIVESTDQAFDLVLTDHMMPVRDGAELVADLRRLPLSQQPGCYVMISSANGRQQQQALASGLVHKLITRPMRHADLVSMLRLATTAPTHRETTVAAPKAAPSSSSTETVQAERPATPPAVDLAAPPTTKSAAKPVAQQNMTGAMESAVERAERSDDGVILLAEDNPVNQKVATAHLRKAGYTVIAVDNGAEAVSAAQQYADQLSLILMDIQMPEVDGLQATAQVRALPGTLAKVPIIALTANAMPGDRENFIAAGMDDYLSKPFRKPDLLSLVEDWRHQRSKVA